MDGLTRKQVIGIAAEYFGACYGFFTSKHYYIERWSVFLTLLLMLLLLLCFVAFAATTSNLWRWILDVLLVIELGYTIYLAGFSTWLNRQYKKNAGLPANASDQDLHKAVMDNLCQKHGVSLENLGKGIREIIGNRNFITALLPINRIFAGAVVAITVGYGVWMTTSLGPNSPVWLYVGVLVAIVAYLFLQYAIVLRIAVWRIRENIIPSRYIPLYVLLADLEKIDRETIV